MEHKLDNIDRKIIEMLQKNARTPVIDGQNYLDGAKSQRKSSFPPPLSPPGSNTSKKTG